VRASATSRAVRLRRFSISARVRSILSRDSAASFASASAAPSSGSSGMMYGLETTGSGACAGFTGSSFCRLGSVIDCLLEIDGDRGGRCWGGISCFKRRKSSATGPVQVRSPAQHPADNARGVIHRRDDPGIVEPRWPDHAENADNMTRAIVVGGNNGRGTGQRKQLVFRSDENPHAFGALGAAQQIDHAALGLEIVEQQPNPFQLFETVKIFKA